MCACELVGIRPDRRGVGGGHRDYRYGRAGCIEPAPAQPGASAPQSSRQFSSAAGAVRSTVRETGIAQRLAARSALGRLRFRRRREVRTRPPDRAFAGVTVQFAAAAGAGWEGGEALQQRKAATVVFRLDGPEWQCDGRAYFNLSPTEILDRYPHEITEVGIVQHLPKRSFRSTVWRIPPQR